MKQQKAQYVNPFRNIFSDICFGVGKRECSAVTETVLQFTARRLATALAPATWSNGGVRRYGEILTIQSRHGSRDPVVSAGAGSRDDFQADLNSVN